MNRVMLGANLGCRQLRAVQMRAAIGHQLEFISTKMHFSHPAASRSTAACISSDSSVESSSPTTAPSHEPPLPVRIALVSTTTALATPSFPALGFLYAVLRLAMPDADLRKAMEGRWGALLSFTTWTALPALYHGSVASLILPCAVSNGLVAGSLYGLVDVASGGPSGYMKQVYNTPLLGSGIGASVGYLAPHYVYGPALELYGFDGMTASISYVLNAPLLTEVSIVTGAIAGLILHPLLYYPIHGVPGVHWKYFSGALLAVSSLAMYYVYYGRESVALPVPEGSYINAKELCLVNSVLRYNVSSGEIETYSLQSCQFLGQKQMYIQGQEIAETARLYGKNGNAVLDDKLLSFIYNYWDEKIRSKYSTHVVDVKSINCLKETQDSLAVTDAAVALLVEQSADAKSGQHTKQIKILSILDNLNTLRGDQNRKQKLKMRASLDEACIALELLMALEHKTNTHCNIASSTLTNDLEQFIRNTCPNIILYTSDEIYPGTSIESQLETLGWKKSELSLALERWDNLCKDKDAHKKKVGLMFVCGVVLSLATSVLIQNGFP